MAIEHPTIVAKRTAMTLLEGIAVESFRAIAIEALRRWRRSARSNIEFDVNGNFALNLVPLLAEMKQISANANDVKEPFLYGQGEPWAQPVIDFFAWMVGSGLAIPLHRMDASLNGYAPAYRLTTAGMRVFDGDGDHPFLPGFVDRAVARCKDLPDEVAVHLADAQSCIEHGLGRPAIVLTGLAYEVAEDAAIDHLGSKIMIKKGAKAADKIDAVRKAIQALVGQPGNPVQAEKRGAIEADWDFADRLRARRNQASHPGAYPDFTDLAEVHEFLLSAGRHLPGLWSVRD